MEGPRFQENTTTRVAADTVSSYSNTTVAQYPDRLRFFDRPRQHHHLEQGVLHVSQHHIHGPSDVLFARPGRSYGTDIE